MNGIHEIMQSCTIDSITTPLKTRWKGELLLYFQYFLYSASFFEKAIYNRVCYINHVLLSITERIKDLVDNGNYVCGIFMDREKGFDTVNYKIVKYVKNLLWSTSELLWLNLIHPCAMFLMGLLLALICFLYIYINNFRLCLTKTQAGHFADNTFILYGSSKLGRIESVVNDELKLFLKMAIIK